MQISTDQTVFQDYGAFTYARSFALEDQKHEQGNDDSKDGNENSTVWQS